MNVLDRVHSLPSMGKMKMCVIDFCVGPCVVCRVYVCIVIVGWKKIFILNLFLSCVVCHASTCGGDV